MTQFNLTLLATIGIQHYIFSSNRLQENIGASEIVNLSTTSWMFEVLESEDENKIKLFKHNIIEPDSLDWTCDPNFLIENLDDDNAVEVIDAVGGTAVLIFRNHQKAVEFARAVTRKVLRNGPGLTLLVKHLQFDWKKDHLADIQDANKKVSDGVRSTLIKLMEDHINDRQLPSPTFALGVTAICDSTGLPASRISAGTQHLDERVFDLLIGDQKNQFVELNRLISREVTFKLAARDLAQERLKHVVGEKTVTKDGIKYEFPSDIDMLGRISGEESYVAVIHADGNRVGKHVENATINKTDNREYIRASREVSDSIQTASRNALRQVVEKLVDAIEIDERDGKRYVGRKVPLAFKNKAWFLPFRPLVFGGDDVTFLCNGQLGIELATKYLEIFQQEAKNIYACAGVSIVKMHYPFARAYQLSEELTHSAKRLVKDSGSDFSALDWHFSQSGLSGSLDVIRQREYLSDQGEKLYIRPLTLKKGTSDNIRSWDEVNSVLQAFNKEPWSESHNKVIGLRHPLRQGPASVEQYRLNFDLDDLPNFAGAEKTGWFPDRCAYFDIIELLDHHVSLTPESNPEPEKDGA